MTRRFFRHGNQCTRVDEVHHVDVGRLELEGKIYVAFLGGGGFHLDGIEAIDFLVDNAPFMLEGRRMRWRRWDWAFHNLVAHPLMQVLAFCRLSKWAMAVHDCTIPRPMGIKKSCKDPAPKS
jgi:hypothetical protein